MKINPNMTIGSVSGSQIKPQGGVNGVFEDLLKGIETGSVNKSDSVGTQFQMNPVNPVKLSAVSASEEAIELFKGRIRPESQPQGHRTHGGPA